MEENLISDNIFVESEKIKMSVNNKDFKKPIEQ